MPATSISCAGSWPHSGPAAGAPCLTSAGKPLGCGCSRQQAVDRAREEGIEFALPAINPKTFRHSFAMHLFFNHVPPKVVQTYMGHERYESTEVYLKVFALDVAPQLGGHCCKARSADKMCCLFHP